MEPTPTEVAAITNLGELLDWVGITASGGFRASVELNFGGEPLIRDIAGLSHTEWDEFVTQYTIQPPAAIGSDGDQPPQRVAPTPLQKSRLRTLWRAARVVMGLPGAPLPSQEPTAQAAGAAPGGAQASAAQAAALSPPAKKVKLSNLVDVTAEAEVDLLDPSRLRAMFEDYEKDRGDDPHKDIEPTAEQLSAVHQLIQSGSAPYVDFSIFGPHGRRFLKKLTFVSFTYLADQGVWRKNELPGPPDFDSWWKSWLVFKCTLLLLKAVKIERLDRYGEHIRSLNAQFGQECWFLVYQADVRMRSEEFERLRRRAEIQRAKLPVIDRAGYPFDPAVPWDGVFHFALKEREFWDAEVRDKSILYLARIKSRNETADDGTIDQPRTSADGGSPPSGKKRKRQRGQGKGGGTDHRQLSQHNVQQPQGSKKGGKKGTDRGSSTNPTEEDRSQQICRNWNVGHCSHPCPNGRRHVCSDCGGSHRSGDPACKAPKGKGSKGGGKRK